MIRSGPVYDLVVVTADADAEQVIRAIVRRPEALGVRPMTANVLRDPRRDPGCRAGSVDLLRQFLGKAQHAIVVFDYEGSGAGKIAADQLEHNLEQALAKNGWSPSQVGVVVIQPELESWVWKSLFHLERVVGWSQRVERLDTWLQSHNWIPVSGGKPQRPKEALQAILKETRTPFTPALFRRLAERVSLSDCQDRAFQKLSQLFRKWFSISEHQN